MKRIIMKDRRRAGGFEICQFLGAALLFLSLLALTACQPEDDADGSQGNITITRIEAGIEGMGTATRAFTENAATGYTGSVKTSFVTGNVIHLFSVSNLSVAKSYSCATLGDDGTWDISPALVLGTDDEIYAYYVDGHNDPYTDNDGNVLGADAALSEINKATDLFAPGDMLVANSISSGSGNMGSLEVSANGTLKIGFVHKYPLVRIASINNQLGSGYDKIQSITAHVVSSTDDSKSEDISLIGNDNTAPTQWQCIARKDCSLEYFTLTFGDGAGNAIATVTVAVKGSILPPSDTRSIAGAATRSSTVSGQYLGNVSSDGTGARLYAYHLLLLPGSATAILKNDDQGPTWTDALRDPTVPAGYIPIYTVEDLQKIGVPTDGDPYTSDPLTYPLAIVNGHTYTTTAELNPDNPGTPLTFSLDGNYILMADIDLTKTPAAGTPAAGASTSPASAFVRSTRGGKFSAASTRASDTSDSKWAPTEGTNWKPIGGVDINNPSNPAEVVATGAPFTGYFNGNGHTIRGMKIGIQLEEKKDNDHPALLGFFGRLSGATIYNLHFEDATVETKKPSSDKYVSVYVGTLAGMTVNSTLTLCSATRCQTMGTSYVGGLVGTNSNLLINSSSKIPSHLTHCYAADCTVKGENDNGSIYVGGLAGNNRAILAACYTTSCTVTAAIVSENDSHNAYAGGLAGTAESTTIYGCYAANAMTTAATTNSGNLYAGVLSGGLKYSSKATSCYATAGSGSSGSGGGSILSNDGTTATATHLIGYIDNGSSVKACVSPLQNGGSSGTSGTDDTAENGGPGGGYYWGANIGYSPLIGTSSSGTTGSVDPSPGVRTVVSINGALSVNTGTWKAIGIWGNIPSSSTDGSQIPPHIRWSYDGENN